MFAALMSFATLLGQTVVPASAASERALYLYYTHTGETARIVFKRNGQFVKSGLDQLNYFLRDWRRNEPTKMDPPLFDLIWQVYNAVGATQPINIVSAYRSPTTNEMLRSRPGSGVAENSQHTKGHAMDFFIPGISLTKLRATAMRFQVGGVGFYPTSGSPFVHLDTGNVRAWPRMTRAQLAAVFPDGKTLHLPADGKPLSESGRSYAMAQWQQCHTVPCGNGAGGSTMVASADDGAPTKTLSDMLFGGDAKGKSAPATIQVASIPQPALPHEAPTPMARPAALGGIAQVAAAPQPDVMPFSRVGSTPLEDGAVADARIAPVPAMKSQALLVATAASLPAGQGNETALTALAALGAPLPAARTLMTNQPADMVTAYAPAPAEPGAQKALELIIQRNTTAALPPLPSEKPQPRALVGASGLRTASLGGKNELAPLVGLFDMTWGAVAEHGTSAPVALALAERPSVTDMRHVDLVAPDLEHVAEVFLTPVAMTSDHFAVIFDHDEADFSPATELGDYVTVMGIGDVPPDFSSERFIVSKPLAVAFR
ncbi:DUF882 domain-containing protein [Devosia sp.]|uniref:DUF882 domain-containing protein n=1 Tax=Devosia sp. TaxID=1871048 RepID=UPI00326337A4